MPFHFHLPDICFNIGTHIFFNDVGHAQIISLAVTNSKHVI